MFYLYLFIFFLSCFFLFLSSHWLTKALSKIASFLGWKEFIVAFFLIAISVSLPNFFIGIISAINKVPELSLGDIVGGNVVALTFLVGLTSLVSKMGLTATSRTVQGSSVFTLLITLLPLLLISDGLLSRADGIILLLLFLVYVYWLFSKKERFIKIYEGNSEKVKPSNFLKSLFLFFVSIVLLSLAAFFVVKSARFFTDYLNIGLGFFGILVLGLSNNLGELAFLLQAAKKSQDWFILGDLMGGVIVTNTLVLGIVSLICPIVISNSLPFNIARIFSLIAIIFFFFFVRSGQKITRREGIILLVIYLIFLAVEIFVR